MDPQDPSHQAPVPLWHPQPDAVEADTAEDAAISVLKERIAELEQTVHDYELLLKELPELFERKFQQRLEPLLERYRLLARAQQLLESPAPELPAEPNNNEQRSQLFRWRSEQRSGRRQTDLDAAA
ncbi:hypothetical protein SynPROS71_02901 [Synechococcus sp. PROS-7-1]|uniref:hypothetical protein n=1 Tax=Synechococcus sp. PROS-7-1 TaxID=1442556 RepID=UPI00164404B0|nr:hypothetical protein [Synechococcus sp. PROS-7-1]QNI86656.1 hypothetical protein SynPROS71_02901 [Synechococcus sp. PROS-7-1]